MPAVVAKVGNNGILEHKEIWNNVKELHTVGISLDLAAGEALDLDDICYLWFCVIMSCVCAVGFILYNVCDIFVRKWR